MLSGWVILLLLAVVVYWYMRRSRWQYMPPGPPSFPIIGSLPFMIGDIRDVFSAMATKYGNIFTVSIGSQRAVVLNGYDVLKQAFLKTPNVFDGRSNMFKHLYDDNCFGIISSDGAMWKEQRRFILHTMRNFGLGKRSMENLIQTEAQHLMNELMQFEGSPFNMSDTLRKAVANVIAVIVFGKRHEYQDESFITYLADTQQLIELLGANNPVMIFTFLRYIPSDPFGYKKLLHITKKWNAKFKEEILYRKQKLTTKEEIVPDLITLYLKQIPNFEKPNGFSYEDQLVHVVSDIFGAGTDTSSNTLLWAILYLVLNPQVQHKVQAEIEQVFAGKTPTMQDQLKMPYTEAFISEVQRICDLVPLGIPHCTMEDTVLNGYTIPKGTMIMPNLHSVHWNPQMWPNPEIFDPNRFLGDDGKYKKRVEFIPFSLGKRSCIGESLARMELFLFLTYLLQTFTFSLPPNQPKPDTKGILGIVHHPKDFCVIMTKIGRQ